MLGFTKSLGWKKSSAIVAILVIAAVAVPNTSAAQKRQSAIEPTATPDAFSLPSQLGTPPPPNSFNSPSQLGTPSPGVSPKTSPDSRTTLNRSRSTRKDRRIPIPDVPMPGNYRPNLDSGPEQTRRLSDIPTTTQLISGISGKVTLTPICSFSAPPKECQPRPYQGSLKITTASTGSMTRFTADADGAFQLKLEPGLYRIESDDPTSPLGSGQVVAVVSGVMRQLELEIQAQLPQSNPQFTQSSPQPTQSNSQSSSQPNSQPNSQSN